jgi:hypothetical protein
MNAFATQFYLMLRGWLSDDHSNYFLEKFGRPTMTSNQPASSTGSNTGMRSEIQVKWGKVGGQETDLEERDTSSGREMRTYICRPCKERVNVDNGVALWKVLHNARKEK